MIEGPSDNQKIISNPVAGLSVSIQDGEGTYNVIVSSSKSREQVIRKTDLDLNIETSKTTGTLSINPNIPKTDVISKDKNRHIIDINETDTNGKFSVETVEKGTVVANVKGFNDHTTISGISNSLYTSKKVDVESVKSNNGIDFTADSSGDVFTISNSTGHKVDVLYESNNGVT